MFAFIGFLLRVGGTYYMLKSAYSLIMTTNNQFQKSSTYGAFVWNMQMHNMRRLTVPIIKIPVRTDVDSEYQNNRHLELETNIRSEPLMAIQCPTET